MNGTEDQLQKFIANFRDQFESMPVEDIAFPRGCNNVAKNSSPATIYGKGCPMHVRGALLYNFYIKKRKLTIRLESMFLDSIISLLIADSDSK